MRAKLQFPTFFLLWVSTVLSLVCSTSPFYGPPMAGVCMASLIIFWWTRSYYDECIHQLRPFIYTMMLLAMLLSVVCGHNQTFIFVMGPTFLGYLYMEGGYRYERLAAGGTSEGEGS